MKSNNLMQDNYRRINQISARCMRVIVVMLLLMFGYCCFVADIDKALLLIFYGISIIIALIPTLVINVLRFDSSPLTKHVVIVCTCICM